MSLHTFHLLREINFDGAPCAWEALDPNGVRVTIWPGLPDPIPPNVHPALPEAIGSGEMEGQPVWIEHRPGAIVLEDILIRISITEGLEWLAQICDAATALHARDRTHGNISAKHIVLSSSGQPFLIGTGQQPGGVPSDLEDLIALAKKLAPLASLTTAIESSAALSTKLRETLNRLPEKTPVQLPKPNDASPVRTADIDLLPLGSTDEILIDMGADPETPGLLDRWEHFDQDDEFTEDPTESADRSMLQTRNPDTIVASLDQHFEGIIELANNRGIAPDEDYRQLILTAPTDPLPIPEGLPHGPLHKPQGDAERTAEVSIDSPTSDAEGQEETTGMTNTAAIPPLYMTGLLTAAIAGMLGAIIMLIVVWLSIDGAF